MKGSHQLYKHPNGKRTIVTLHNKDIPKGTLNAILKQAGLK
nr:type II toxin-antitoxin system HicA family toxin [Marivirga sp.]